MTTFYLGTHQPGWLNWVDVPLFISDRRLRDYKRLPRAAGPWALDSGGFTELSTHGSWDHGPTPAEYVARIRRYDRVIGKLQWAAPQDWMCEPFITAKTGLTVNEHQWRTIDNWIDLDRLRTPDMPPIIKVVQGYTIAEYLRHVDYYRNVGLDLTEEPLVGVGSVCRRQAMDEAGEILQALHNVGVTRLHGFGFKKLGLQRFGHLLTSADSLAWSYDARRSPLSDHCWGGQHKNCANCPQYALAWRTRLLDQLKTTAFQPTLLDVRSA